MLIDDPLLPAAAHLTGPDASHVLEPAVVASGGRLVECRTSQVQYRPESDLVVRYRCVIRRGDRDVTDTLLAATTTRGPFDGTVPIEAETADGTTLSVGVWRWPFDPVLIELEAMVTPTSVAERLTGLVGPRPAVDVVAYRPTERAVVRVIDDRRELYVKVVPVDAVDALVARHDRLAAAGLPVPEVVATGTGWIAMTALTGTTLRERLKNGAAVPAPVEYRRLLGRLSDVDLATMPPVRSRIVDASHHAAMLATVAPDAAGRLREIVERLGPNDQRSHCSTTHGDLHEGQMIVDDRHVLGVLDIDDVGPGDPLDDVGTLVGHLAFRALTSGDRRIAEHAAEVRRELSIDHGAATVDRHTAAVLVGLATGPFRIQQPDWPATTRQVLDLVESHLDAAG